MKKKVTYKSTGVVYGKLWMGGEGTYEARKLTSSTKKALLKEANDKLDGTLDGGMGFEGLLGALLFIEKITEIYVDGKLYRNREHEHKFIGKLTQKQKDFCFENS